MKHIAVTLPIDSSVTPAPFPRPYTEMISVVINDRAVHVMQAMGGNIPDSAQPCTHTIRFTNSCRCAFQHGALVYLPVLC